MPEVTNEVYEAPRSGYLLSRLKLETGTKFKLSKMSAVGSDVALNPKPFSMSPRRKLGQFPYLAKKA
jgi:hypothetical protein